jgi:glyoxylase-like metal-dependent hydrolase (beta-lactamase superfamily II)
MPLTIRPLNTGFVTTVPRQYLYHHSVLPYRQVPEGRVDLPIFSFLIQGGGDLILVDTGMAWTERAGAFHHPGSRQPEGMAIHERLADLGLSCLDVDLVILTHLHWDHCYYLDRFAKAAVMVHQREREFAYDPIPLYYKSYEHPFLGITRPFEGVPLIDLKGETRPAPGIAVLETPGHSPGHVSVEVETAQGPFIIAGDSVFVPENLEPVEELGYDLCPPGRFYDIVETWGSIRKQKARAAAPDRILCSHDQGLLARLEAEPVLGRG